MTRRRTAGSVLLIVSSVLSSAQRSAAYPPAVRRSGIATTPGPAFLRGFRPIGAVPSAAVVAGWTRNVRCSTRLHADDPTTSSRSIDGGVMDRAFAKIGKSTSALVALTFFAFLAYYRDALMVSFFIGAIANGILSKVLKKIINQSRPTSADYTNIQVRTKSGLSLNVEAPPSDGGMPSSHGMSLGFICTFTAIAVPWTKIPLFVYSMISLTYRVQSQLHTWQQITVGAIVGSVNGYVWHDLCFGGTLATAIGQDNTVMEWVSLHLLDDQELLPLYLLVVPALVGAVVVGSFERRLAAYLEQRKID